MLAIRSWQQQSGTAIFTALLVVVVASAVSVGLMVRMRIDLKRTEQIITSEQAYQYATGALYWAQVAVSQLNPETIEEWPMILPATWVADNQGVVTATIMNASQRVNLNAVKTDETNFVELLQNLPLNLSQVTIQSLVNELQQFISLEQAEDADDKYLAKDPPYLSSRRELVSASEIRLVAGFTPKITNAILPQVIAYPAEITKGTHHGPLYLLKTEVKLKEQTQSIYALLQREENQDKVQARVLWQSWSAY